MADEPWKDFFAAKELTSDLTSKHFPIWSAILNDRRDKPLRILEIGSWEGGSAIFFAEFFPNATVTCVDTFAGGPSEIGGEMGKQIPHIERRFDHNVAPYGERVRKIKANSILALGQLREEGNPFDLVYIDGEHTRDVVLAESTLCWPLLNPNGVLIWDDYKAGRHLPLAERVRQGADVFLWLHAGEFDELRRRSQLIVRRRAEPRSSLAERLSLLYRIMRNLFRRPRSS